MTISGSYPAQISIEALAWPYLSMRRQSMKEQLPLIFDPEAAGIFFV
jgi:hypothetical protein